MCCEYVVSVLCIINTLVWYFKYYASLLLLRFTVQISVVRQGSGSGICARQVNAVGCDHMFDIVRGDCESMIHMYCILHYAFAAVNTSKMQFCCLSMS